MEGFERYTDASDLELDSNVALEESSAFSFVTGKDSLGRAVRMNGTAPRMAFPIVGGTASTFYLGFAFRVAAYPSSYTNILYAYEPDYTDLCFTLRLNANGTMEYLRTGAISLGTTGAIAENAWNYLVLKVFIDNTTGTLEFWRNGTKDLDLTGQDTRDTGTSIGAFRFHAPNGGTWDYDDIYIGDNSGSDMTDQVGEVHIEMVLPNADGNRNNFTRVGGGTNNYEAVDDGTTSDGDTTYLYSSTATNGELFGHAALTGNVDTIYAVNVAARVRKEDAGNRSINLIARSSATESDSGQKGMNTYYTWQSAFFENDPNGGGAWTESAVNAAEFGLEIGV